MKPENPKIPVSLSSFLLYLLYPSGFGFCELLLLGLSKMFFLMLDLFLTDASVVEIFFMPVAVLLSAVHNGSHDISFAFIFFGKKNASI